MYLTIRFCFLFSIIVGLAQPLHAQSNNNISTPTYQEKVYVQTDKPAYLCGEIIWLKGNVLNAANLHFSDLSKVLYVELLNGNGAPVLQSKIAVDSGRGDGSLLIPTNIPSGQYQLRAYTAWMKNFPAQYFYQRVITIYNTTDDTENLEKESASGPSIDFFPEGGELIIGIKNSVAFKMIDAAGKGFSGSGVIVDNLGDTVSGVKSYYLGMGKFSLTPQAGKTYSFKWSQDGNDKKVDLPKTVTSGFNLQVEELNGSLNVLVSKSDNLDGNNTALQVRQNGVLIHQYPLNFSGKNATINVPMSDLSAGVNQLTVMNGKTPVSERIYFKTNPQIFSLNAKLSAQVFSNRSKAEVEITPELNTTAYLTSTVYALDGLTHSGREDIQSAFWLRPYIVGPIENGSYYFSNTSESNKALDLLMLTQGWRKFVPAPSKTSTQNLPDLTGHLITGIVTNAATNKPEWGIFVFLSVPGKRVQTRVSVSNAQGMVYFPMQEFYANNQLVIQMPEVIKNSYKVEILSPFSEQKTEIKTQGIKLSAQELADLKRNHLNVQVNNSFHDLNQMEKLVVDSTPFYVTPYKTYKLSDYTRFTTMEEVMREYVTEVNVRKTGNQFRLRTYNDEGFKVRDMQSAEVVFEKDPLVFLDGIPVFDMNKIIEYDPLKVERLDVIATRYRLGAYTADGILNYTSYFGNLEGFNADDRDIVVDYEGLQPKRIFYAPKYVTPLDRESRIPDFRSVLYWNPELKADGQQKLSFYTGDLKGKFLMVIEGISSDGKIGSTTTTFEVK